MMAEQHLLLPLHITPVVTVALAFGTGIFFHIIYNRIEPTVRSFYYHTLLTATGFTALTLFDVRQAKATAVLSFIFVLVDLATLGLSITLYRLFFHPLRRYPGPVLAKLTKWTGAYWTATGDLHTIVQALHEKYGEIVRIGPNELSFSNPDAIKAIHGVNGAKLTRGPYHDGSVYGSPGSAMPNTRDWEDHKIRRRLWDHGFAQKQLLSYEPRVLELLDFLCARLKEFDGQVIDLGRWMDFITFDVMGVLGFSKSFGMLRDDGPHFYSEFVRSGIKLKAVIANVPWISPLAYLLPLPKEFKENAAQFKALSKASFVERRAKGTAPDDIFTFILGETKEGRRTKEADLEADAPVLIIGGSDTSSVAAKFLFYFISREPKVYSRLREELDHAWDGKSVLTAQHLSPGRCPYLNGVTHEALRIGTPGPNHNQRRTPPEGHEVCGERIPGNTQVACHLYTLHRDEKNFTNPLEFAPDRWNDAVRDPTWDHVEKAWIPFSTGNFACAGRQLALNELKFIVTRVLNDFDVIMPDDFDHEAFWGAVKSYQSLIMGPLPLLIRSRLPRSAKP